MHGRQAYDEGEYGLPRLDKTGMNMWMLGAEAGAAEAELMVTEKVRAAIKLQARLMTGALDVTPLEATQGPLKHYQRKVAANNRWLTGKREGKAR